LLQYSGVQLTAEGIVMTELVRTIAEDWGSGAKETLHESSQSTWGTRKPN